MKWKVTCLQMDVTFGDPEANYRHAEQLARQASIRQESDGQAAAGAAVLALPELWTTGYDLARLPAIADWNGSRTLPFLSELAVSCGSAIVGGSYARLEEDGIRNTMPFVDSSGRNLGSYDKLHLFGPMDEPSFLLPGSRLGRFALDGIPCAGVVCYDIRFPEWIRAHALAGAEVLFVAAEWPASRLDHWRTLLTARAIENQCFVVACNRAGSDPTNRFAGHSLILDPWGAALAEGGMEEELVSAELDLSLVQEVRSRFPVFRDRRPDLYGAFGS